MDMQLCIGGTCKNDSNENALAGARGWFPADDRWTFAVRLPPTIQTTLAAEFAAISDHIRMDPICRRACNYECLQKSDCGAH